MWIQYTKLTIFFTGLVTDVQFQVLLKQKSKTIRKSFSTQAVSYRKILDSVLLNDHNR